MTTKTRLHTYKFSFGLYLFCYVHADCPAGEWGPPDCLGVCDKCYNGGVCDEYSGMCICPNNFKGQNCLESKKLDKRVLYRLTKKINRNFSINNF